MPAVHAERLRDRRDELDLGNRELAELVKISRAYLVNILCGANNPSKRVIYRLAHALELSVEEIVRGDVCPPERNSDTTRTTSAVA